MIYSPLSMARDECANFNESNGSCFGVTVESLAPKPGQPARAKPLARCLLASGERCGYFERAVLPLAERGNPKFLEAREAYYAKALRAAGLTPKAEMKARTIVRHSAGLDGLAAARLCQCGKPKAARKQFCEACKKLHRKASFRREKNRQRGTSYPVLQSSPKPGPQVTENTEPVSGQKTDPVG